MARLDTAFCRASPSYLPFGAATASLVISEHLVGDLSAPRATKEGANARLSQHHRCAI